MPKLGQEIVRWRPRTSNARQSREKYECCPNRDASQNLAAHRLKLSVASMRVLQNQSFGPNLLQSNNRNEQDTLLI